MGGILRRALTALQRRSALSVAPMEAVALDALRKQKAETALLKAELAKAQQALAATTALLANATVSVGRLTQAVMDIAEGISGAAGQEHIQAPLAEVLQLSVLRQARNEERAANASPIERN